MATFPSLRRRVQDAKTLPPSYRTPDATQRYMAAPKYRDEHYNASSDYIYGLQNRKPETPPITLDEYIEMVHHFREMARTFDLPQPTVSLLPTYEELAELTDHLGEEEILIIEEEGIE